MKGNFKKKISLMSLAMVFAVAFMQVFYVPQIENVSAQEQTIVVNKDNFLDYFSLNGNASYDAGTGLLNLTENLPTQVGNASLKTKIDFTKPFSMKMKVNIGDKDQCSGGADGVGLVFHTDDIDAIGTVGNGFGAGGLNNVVGFKLDTNYNISDEASTKAAKDPARYGWCRSFGAFMNTDNALGGILRSYADITNPEGDMKEIPNPSGNVFRDFEMSYDGNGFMSVTYDGITWKCDVVNVFGMTELMRSFNITASTAEYFNSHQIQFDSFTYTADRGTVITHHVDENGNTLADSETLLGNPLLTNEAYTTSAKTISGYEFKEVKAGSDPVSGEFEDGVTKVITYVYSQVTGSLTVRYEDESGNLLEPETTTSAVPGTTYATTQKSFTGYTFKEMKSGSASTSGTYEANVSKVVTYVYTLEKGNLIVRYEDEDGNALESETASQGNDGTAYATTQKSFAGYTFKEMKSGSAPANGTFETGVTKTVTYVYSQIKGTLVVRYVDEDDNLLEAATTTQRPVGETYATTQKTFPNYTFKEMKSGSDPVNGVYEANATKTVTYVYAKDKGTLVVRYVDEDNNLLEVATTTQKPVGDSYTTTQKAFAGYTFKEMHSTSAPTSGVYENGVTKTVIYVYTKDTGSLIVRYEDEAGNLLEVPTSSIGDAGASYTTILKAFEDYSFKNMKSGSASVSGTYEKDVTKIVIFVYERDKGTLIVRHEDENGELLTEQMQTTKNTKEIYTTYQMTFEDYTFFNMKEGSSPISGIYEKNQTKIVTYVYTRDKGSLIVRHEDEQGNELEPEVKTIENTKVTYTTSSKTFNGYKFVKVKEGSASETGEYEKNIEKTVTYVYKKDKKLTFHPNTDPTKMVNTADTSNINTFVSIGLLAMIALGLNVTYAKISKKRR